MIAVKLWGRFLRSTGLRATDVLAIVAFAFATAAALLVGGGILAFWNRTLADPSDYVSNNTAVLSLVAGALLLPAIWTLSQSAVRLAITRRDARLAALRLVGATRGQVAGMTVLDTLLQTLSGVVLGIGLYYALVPAVSLLPFGGDAFAGGELLLPIAYVGLVVAAVLSIALVSAISSLVAVSLSPLGVAQRTKGAKPNLIRIALLVVVAGVWIAVTQFAGLVPANFMTEQGWMIFMLVMMTMMGVAIAVIGPLVVWFIAFLFAAGARSAQTLIAARTIMDDPRSSFNTVGPLALGVMAGGLASLASMFNGVEDGDQMLTDLTIGAMLTVAIAGVLGAVFAGVSQSARILDRGDAFRSQHLMGMETGVLVSSTMRGAVIPVATLIGTSVAGTLLLMLPFMGFLAGNATPVLVWLGIVVAAVALIMLATWISTLLLPRVTRVA
ncbi:MAG: FtsX-like permease family protein [Agrococcus casei]|uniref:FtsX-like permease family protein n=1 Tax=Agrococcus casei TaxID=343512 RepID=UPI003F8F27D8